MNDQPKLYMLVHCSLYVVMDKPIFLLCLHNSTLNQSNPKVKIVKHKYRII